MRFNMKQPIILFVIVSLVFFPFGSAALAENQHNHEEDIKMAGDILVARPLGLIATVGGTVLFIVALPFSLLGGNTQEVYQQLVVKPAKYTFVRPVGHFD
jgi:uncharacterized membrane protein